ncbi:hypothetical protein T440DRAFT_263909 [Plenodomus tracheiphilus IPT5]|uniref:Uncharacterized protein n=1 Tax=Plenodomus tracheiphilus IPT5 TaxID=1408161 RepID=A0A6A7AQI2_9PLEO|nr:hypothetical protein T440DRAFT_263909 [Plenodomus tracheiphilus IPT5]
MPTYPQCLGGPSCVAELMKRGAASASRQSPASWPLLIFTITATRPGTAQPPLAAARAVEYSRTGYPHPRSEVCTLHPLSLSKLLSLAVAPTLHNAACAEDHGALPHEDAQRGRCRGHAEGLQRFQDHVGKGMFLLFLLFLFLS